MRFPAAFLLCALLPGIAPQICRHGADGPASNAPQLLRIASTTTGFVITPIMQIAPRSGPSIPIGSGLHIDRALLAGSPASNTLEAVHADR